MNTTRKIIEINEELCNGCGQCILDCAEHALAIVDGKAKVISDALCDGLGACLQGCPQDALTIIERQAAPFDEDAVKVLQKKHANQETLHAFPTQTAYNLMLPAEEECSAAAPSLCLSLRTAQQPTSAPWPLKLRILLADAPFLQNTSLLFMADCAPAVYTHFHSDFGNKTKISCCPKFEDHDQIAQKILHILAKNPPATLDVLRMEVPCCKGMQTIMDAVLAFLRQNNKKIQAQVAYHVCSRDGTLVAKNV